MPLEPASHGLPVGPVPVSFHSHLLSGLHVEGTPAPGVKSGALPVLREGAVLGALLFFKLLKCSLHM